MVVGIYLALLVVSHLYLALRPEGEREGPKNQSTITVEGKRLAYREWGGADPKKDPLILLHGSPSRGSGEFEALGKELASEGRRVIAIDRWGFGASEPWVKDYSFAADRKAVLAVMDQLGLRTAHLGGWSYGGAPVIELAEAQPGRIRSVTLLAAIGDQKGEGSGNYYIEHAKYAGLFGLAMGLPELVPHFGLMGPRHFRYAFVRDFWDGDQRRTAWHLQQMKTPALIIHGKDDPLIPAWVAFHHHQLKPASRLVMLEGNHFFPMAAKSQNFEIATTEMREFLANVEAGKSAELTGFRNETDRKNFRALWKGGPSLRGPKNWWAVLVVGGAFGFFAPRTGAVLAGLAGGLLVADLVTGLCCVAVGAMIRRGESTRPRKFGVVMLWGIAASIPAALLLGVF
jgi:pimeloyl-ACP methyl ester carboxylesterase